MRKNTAVSALIAGALFVVAGQMISAANAQLFTYGASTTAATSSVTIVTVPSTTISSTSSTSSSSVQLPIPVVVIPTSTTAQPSGFIQFNDLTVQSISSPNIPSNISVDSTAVSCELFASADATVGTPMTCPTAASTSTSFTVEVSAATNLLLNDRTSAILANFTPGDAINVFGFYDGTGNIEADVVRDLSKPVGGVMTTSPGVPSASLPTIAAIETQLNTIETLITQIIQQIEALTPTTSTVMTTSTSSGTIY